MKSINVLWIIKIYIYIRRLYGFILIRRYIDNIILSCIPKYQNNKFNVSIMTSAAAPMFYQYFTRNFHENVGFKDRMFQKFHDFYRNFEILAKMKILESIVLTCMQLLN